ncbi:MAG: DUF1152 domain-containing protein [Nanoarchaeota archaeon]|nr:DUF1152 domain-containing protein [Nanoarchaeota archaeon]MBU1444953.1 DUF1152 domain-containing protein [Nanoarchaeota archaeon]MBU2420425.1 DUF1152 domain-containing protein [Nanoarchaeota archaeon]MBU2475707.1 DUF1152 domain-containing protein [Nanoarchaeota archaeon]
MINNFHKYKKVLVIGAGSGRDIASSVLITEKLKKEGVVIDLAGFLTPWALHLFNGKLEKPINKLNSKTAKKFIITKENESLNSFFEPELIEINKKFKLGIRDIYLFSLQYGTNKLKVQLENLIKRKSYDLIIAVDVGGDILARKKDLGSIFTPIVDFSCLEILSKLKKPTAKVLSVVAPGVDGELNKKQLNEIFKEYKKDDLVLGNEIISKQGVEYQKFLNVYNEINLRTNSQSHTCKVIKKLVEEKSNFKEEYQKRLKIGKKTWVVRFPVELDKNISNRIFYFDLNKIKSTRMDINIKYSNILEAFHNLKKQGVGGTEVDLAYVPGKIKGGKYSDCKFILNPFSRVSIKQKENIINYGLLQVNKGKIKNLIIN